MQKIKFTITNKDNQQKIVYKSADNASAIIKKELQKARKQHSRISYEIMIKK